MKKYIIIFALVILQTVVHSQIEHYTSTAGTKVKYYQDYLSFLETDGKTKLDVFIKVPYSSVQFIKTGQGFEAGYSVTVSIFDEEEDRLITEKIWNEKIVAISFELTTSPDNFNLGHRSFDLKPGVYTIKTILLDTDSKNEYSSENKVTVKDFNFLPSNGLVLVV